MNPIFSKKENHTSAQSVAQIFAVPSGEYAQVLEKVHRLDELNRILRKVIDSALFDHCRIVRFESDVLTLLIDHSNWFDCIRYQVPHILQALQKIPSFQGLQDIRCIISRNEEIPFE